MKTSKVTKEVYNKIVDYLQKEYNKGNKVTDNLKIFNDLNGEVSFIEIRDVIKILEQDGSIEWKD